MRDLKEEQQKLSSIEDQQPLYKKRCSELEKLMYESIEKKKASDVERLADEAHKDFRNEMSYGSYLNLEKILNAQQFMTDKHDEAMFIIIHQVAELWIKLFLLEMEGAQDCIRSDNLRMAFKILTRVSKIQDQLVNSWSILSTMTPIEFQGFRDKLGHASGFQSYGYKEIEYRLGNKNPLKLIPHKQDRFLHDHLTNIMKEKSIYDEVLALLYRRGLVKDKSVFERDFSLTHESNVEVKEAWYTIYKNSDQYWELYELAEKLVDIEDSFKQWKYRHLITVNRTIGNQQGTGGTQGGSYLEKALQIRYFPELWEVRTDIFDTKKTKCPFNY